MGNRIGKKEKLVEKALKSLQLIQDTYKQAKDRQISPYDYPAFQDAWDKAGVNKDSLRKYLDKTGDKLVYAGDDPWNPRTIELQDLSLQLGNMYFQSNAKSTESFTKIKEDIRTGSKYSEQGTWLSIGGTPNVPGLAKTVNLSGDESFEGWKDKSTFRKDLMEPIIVKGRR